MARFILIITLSKIRMRSLESGIALSGRVFAKSAWELWSYGVFTQK